MESRIINGVKCFAPESRNQLIQYAFNRKSVLVAVNAEKILHATDETRTIINSNLGYPDGYGAILALKKEFGIDAVKVPGCELWLNIIDTFACNKKFYLVGGKKNIISTTVQQLKSNYHDIEIVGYCDGYLSESDELDLIADIQQTKPDIVFVAMGSPRQELLMQKMSQLHPALYQGLGGSFDVFTGKVKRASPLWVKYNLEWLYRLLQEPKRIFRQVLLVKFLALLYLGRFKT